MLSGTPQRRAVAAMQSMPLSGGAFASTCRPRASCSSSSETFPRMSNSTANVTGAARFSPPPAQLLPLLLLAAMCLSCVTGAQAVLVSRDQIPALSLLRVALDPANASLASWQPAADCQLWKGVTCDFSGNVVSLFLSRSNLQGIIPSSLSGLETLTAIDLLGNSLKEAIPDGLSVLTGLQLLSLAVNSFSGPIPDIFASLTALTYLNLSENKLSGQIPSSITSLVVLQSLKLNYNLLSGSIPESIGNLKSLFSLDFSGNRINGTIPASLGQLTALTYMVLGSNQLEGSIPLELSSLTQLVNFDLSINHLEGDITDVFSGYSSLQQILLEFNSLTGPLPPSIGNHESLFQLQLNSNMLSGSLPDALSRLTALHTLQVGVNNFSGPIPDWISAMTSLTRIIAHSNQFSSSLPAGISKLTNLDNLDLSENLLSGSLPDVFEPLQSLNILEIRECSLEGNVPLSVTSISTLTLLDFSTNNLSGTLPSSFTSLTNLSFFAMCVNSLTGPLPKLPLSISTIDLSSNQFSDSFVYTQLPNVTVIILPNAGLSGTLPSSLAGLATLSRLDLSGNKIEGPLPVSYPSSLKTLNLASNKINGSLPAALPQLGALESLILNNNQLEGAVPDFDRALSLVFVSLADNNFEGPVPSALLTRGGFTLGLANTPWCRQSTNIVLPSCSEDATSGIVTWNPPQFCPGLTCAGHTAPSSALYTSGECVCADYIDITFFLTSPAFSVVTSATATTLRAKLAGVLLDKVSNRPFLTDSQIWIDEVNQEEDGQLIFNLHLFTLDGSPWSDAVKVQIIAALWEGHRYGGFLGPLFGPYELPGAATAHSAAPSPAGAPAAAPSPSPSSSSSSSSAIPWWAYIVIVIGACCLLLLLLLLIVLIRRRRKATDVEQLPTASTDSSISKKDPLSDLTLRVQEHFVKSISLEEILKATNNFSDENVLGEGGHGSVYRGTSSSGQQWAVKRSKIVSSKALLLFQNEVDCLSKVSHRNLVRLLGYCDERNEQILVYELVTNGSLMDHIRPKPGITRRSNLSFLQRLDIAIGTAEGLHYLHSFANPGIIHRDVKSENILLTDTLQPKLADFGLLKSMLDDSRNEGVSTRIAGTPGYMDPEYYKTFKVTAKSDVYSFGVVLLELITGKPPAMDRENSNSNSRQSDPNSSAGLGGQNNSTGTAAQSSEKKARQLITIAEWAFPLLAVGNIDAVADPSLGADFPRNALKNMGTVALHCIQRDSEERPDMGEVVRMLQDIQSDLKGRKHPKSFLPSDRDYSGVPLVGDNSDLNLTDTVDLAAPSSVVLGGR